MRVFITFVDVFTSAPLIIFFLKKSRILRKHPESYHLGLFWAKNLENFLVAGFSFWVSIFSSHEARRKKTTKKKKKKKKKKEEEEKNMSTASSVLETHVSLDGLEMRDDSAAVISINASEGILQEAILEEENEEDQEELSRVARQRNIEKLLDASSENKLNKIEEILAAEENIINVAASTAEKVCALHACTSSKAVNFLIKRGADVRVRSRSNDQPLHVQCYAKNLKAIQYLLQAGADVNSVGSFGNRPLHFAVSAAKIAPPQTSTSRTINNGNSFQTNERNIDKEQEEEEEEEVDVDTDDEDVENIDDARVRIVMELLSRGADVHSKNDNAQTPLLLLANTQENASVADLLLKVQNREQSAREEIIEELARLKLHEAITLRGERML